MSNHNKLKILNSLDLKILAMALMLCDHLWAVLIPGNRWLTDIGRMAFPIFAFQLAEGYFMTGNFRKYFSRMLLFALISEIPFNLMYSGEVIYPFHQNVLFSFCLGLLLMHWIEGSKKKGKAVFIITAAAAAVLGFFAATALMLDYFGFGILMLLVFYFSHGKRLGWIIELAGMIWINGFLMAGLSINFTLFGHEIFFPQQAFAVFALLPIWLYNHKRGPGGKAVKLACYSFYPLHMLILALIRSAL